MHLGKLSRPWEALRWKYTTSMDQLSCSSSPSTGVAARGLALCSGRRSCLKLARAGRGQPAHKDKQNGRLLTSCLCDWANCSSLPYQLTQVIFTRLPRGNNSLRMPLTPQLILAATPTPQPSPHLALGRVFIHGMSSVIKRRFKRGHLPEDRMLPLRSSGHAHLANVARCLPSACQKRLKGHCQFDQLRVNSMGHAESIRKI
ncbi:hypothetical protein RRG08_044139 [Elysia crispata]|uniref:Uncharacterized protein n=1 Tax=Elysia crispata TaxID=231223 RepID=A0AAE0Z7E2_9GAST|nr:hypothetical protein RRG08_044139 [Elysia crispata]